MQQTLFRCRPASGKPRKTAEAQMVEWLTEAEVTDRMDAVFAVRVLDAHRNASLGPVLRTHDGVQVLESCQLNV